jgi:hypothetical protein
MDSRLRTKYISLFPHNRKDHFWPLQTRAAARTRATERIAPATVRAALAIYTGSVTASVRRAIFFSDLTDPEVQNRQAGQTFVFRRLLWNTFSGCRFQARMSGDNRFHIQGCGSLIRRASAGVQQGVYILTPPSACRHPDSWFVHIANLTIFENLDLAPRRVGKTACDYSN